MPNGTVNSFRIFDIGSSDGFTEIKPCTANGSRKEDAVSSSDLKEMILKSLNQPKRQKSIATFLLYDELGLQLFDEITRLEEYYLTNAERTILQDHADELAGRVNNGTIIVELGSGSLTKTQLILRAMERNKKCVTYYALDLNRNELERSLSSLDGPFKYIQLVGLVGTYDQAIPWLKQQYPNKTTQKLVLWLGSSVGNHTRRESAIFLRQFVCSCLQPGDFVVIGFDRRNDPSTVLKAYNDEHGITGKFIMNCLSHVNSILGEPFFNLDDFEYHSTYQENYGRHVSHFRAKRAVNLVYRKERLSDDVTIPVEQGELIHLEFSHKYSNSEIAQLLEAAELDLVQTWSDSNFLYRLVLSRHHPVQSRNDDDVIDKFFPYDNGSDRICDQNEFLECSMCNTKTI
ncbi:ergothioneine biosynthesis protein 1-like [Bradysia coprophila]|uniref:ergothioneine biosynthesis protein 1-like n=1 Tax=Bradysia coprophila TaxID=38358 RepID=UPI00187DB6B9|nr:ergothioneine biosynthesis protein 1-like [Bradysia coprophila]